MQMRCVGERDRGLVRLRDCAAYGLSLANSESGRILAWAWRGVHRRYIADAIVTCVWKVAFCMRQKGARPGQEQAGNISPIGVSALQLLSSYTSTSPRPSEMRTRRNVGSDWLNEKSSSTVLHGRMTL